MEALMIAGWVLLIVLTVGPIFSAQKREGGGGSWFWIVAAVLMGPLAGVGYYMSRHAMRKVDEARRITANAETRRTGAIRNGVGPTSADVSC